MSNISSVRNANPRAHPLEDKADGPGTQVSTPRDLKSSAELALAGAAVGGLLSGAVAQYFGAQDASTWSYIVSVCVVLIPTTIATTGRLAKRELGVDVIAVLAMVGALALGEYLAGAIIAVMLTGGTALER